MVCVSHVMQFESLPNEILMNCFEYFHTCELYFSFSQLNYRFNELIRTLPWQLHLPDVHRSIYDLLCQEMLSDPDLQKQVYSLRLSSIGTPGQINDFLSKFSLDQFTHLRSLIFIGFYDNHMPQISEILPKLTQITALSFLKSDITLSEVLSSIPIANLYTLSLNSNLAFIQQTLPLKSFSTNVMFLNELCRLFQYTPSLQYLKVSCINVGFLRDEYHQSSRPVHLKHLILPYFLATYNDFIHFLWNMNSIRRLTIGSVDGSGWVDASRWEQLITSSLPSLKDFRFRLGVDMEFVTRTPIQIFERFQTDFWLKKHHWPTELAIEQKSFIIYTTPYSPRFPKIPLKSRKLSNPLFDDTQTFKDVHVLGITGNELLEHGNYYFPNVTTLIIGYELKIDSENDEQALMRSLHSLLNLSNIKHLEIPLNCRTRRTSLFFQIIQSAPQLSSLCMKQCFFQFLATHPETCGCMKNKIRRLSLQNDCPHGSHPAFRMNLFPQSVPNLEQLRVSTAHISDLYFLLEYSCKLSALTVHFTLKDHPEQLEKFKKQACEQGAIVNETIVTYNTYSLVILYVWIGGEIL